MSFFVRTSAGYTGRGERGGWAETGRAGALVVRQVLDDLLEAGAKARALDGINIRQLERHLQLADCKLQVADGQVILCHIVVRGRGIALGVNHNTDADLNPAENPGVFDTNFDWAQWQVSAATDYEITFRNPAGNTSLTQVRVDYFNSASAVQVVPAANVPEPTSAVLATSASFLLLLMKRRTRVA